WQAIAAKPQQMIDLVEPGDLIGPLEQQASLATGVVVGTSVVSAGADKACETLTSSGASSSVASISLGTTATISITQPKYREAFRYLPPYPSLVEQQYINEIQLQRGFWLLSHFIEQYGTADQIEAEKLGISVEALVCRRISEIPAGSDGLFVQPFWSPGVIYPGPEARGSIVGFTPNHQRNHLYRALIEGILYSLKEGLERLKRISPEPISLIRISGGGSQSDVVMQMASDIFNLPCETLHTHETSGLGAAIAVAKCTGYYSNIAQAAQAMSKIGQRFEPQADAVLYQQIYQQHSRYIYRHLKPFYQKYAGVFSH
ncbi:MAG: carbohydrate kinase, partial [Gammaproteobacteria bacterium]|nr:carbohydrate kinase [Gammaproteobacteria bacterium]